MDLPSVLGGLAQGFVDFGKSAVDLFGTGGAAFADLIQGTGTKNQDDFRKWLYQTDSVQDAAAKGLGTALNGAQTISDYVIPGGISKSLLFNAGQGALGGLADEFKTYGENYDLGRAGQRALVSAGAAGAGTGLANALKKSGSGLLQSGLAQGASRGALSGAINQGGYAAIDGGDIAQSALQGAGMGALLGGATGAVQDFMPRKQQYMPLTDEEKTARIANAKQMLETATTPERRAELQAQINRLGGTLENTLAADDMAVNAAMEPEGFTYDYDGSDMAAVQRAYNLATQDQAKLDGMLKEISDTLGTEFSSAGQKSTKSMLDKIERKVRAGRDYTVASMKDHTRGKVMMNNFSEIPQVLQELDRRGIPYETEVVTNPWGYKGYHITFRNPDGISSEIQLTTAAHWPAKLESDAIYDKWRNFDFDAATEAEQQKYNQAMAKSQALWAKVDFSEFDKAANSLSDTGRESWSVDPNTLKSGLTQEPSLYTKTPLPSESANMSPSSVTQRFSGLGFDRSPNIDSPPFNDIIPQNTSRTLEGVLSADDLKVNSAKIAPGQLDLFSDYKPKPKAEAPINGLDYYGSDIEMLTPGNPYAPVNGQVTQEMRDRANYIIDNLALHRQIPENELYNQINPETLPKGHYETGKILDEAYSNNQSIRPLLNNIVEEKFTEQFGDSPSKEKLISYLYGDGDADSKKMAVNKDIGIYMEPEKLHEETLKDLARSRIKTDLYGEGLYALSEENKTVRGGYTGALDSALSERLGIAPGNTYKKIGNYDQGSWVAGRYARSKSHAGDENIMVGPAADNEKALSTLGHERLHSFQAETKEVPGRENRYSQEVKDAYTELAKDLKAAKAYKTGKEIKDWYGRDVAYWRLHDEQEARMFQQYLAENGYTGQQPKMSNKVYHPVGSKEFDSSKITPAFDKFIDKLRDLSKRGVALPALAGLVGGGAVLDQILNSKEEDKKKTKRSV